jgi:hypothetical protein
MTTMRDSHLDECDLLLLLDHEVPLRRARQLRAHLEACEWCRARQTRLASTLAEARPSEEPELPADAAVQRARLARGLASHATAPAARWLPASGAARLGFAAGLAIFVVTIGLGTLPARDVDARVFLRPRVDLTPGATRPITVAETCGNGRMLQARGVPASVHQRVFVRYGADFRDADEYELDYLITPELGGSDAPENLWPQPFSRTPWNAYVKDELELHQHAEVCAGRMELAAAQREIAGDWIAAYQRHFQTTVPRRDYAAAPVTLDDTALVLSELGEIGVTLQSSHASSARGL